MSAMQRAPVEMTDRAPPLSRGSSRLERSGTLLAVSVRGPHEVSSEITANTLGTAGVVARSMSLWKDRSGPSSARDSARRER